MADITGFAGPTGNLDEHQAKGGATSGDSAANYEPTDAEKRAIRLAEKVFDRAKKHRAQYDYKWLDFYNMFRGKQWKDQRPSYRHSEVINLIFRSLQSSVPLQMDTRPKFEFLPQEPGDYEFSQLMNQLSDADWSKNNWGETLLEVVWDSNIYGTGLSSLLAKEHLGKMKLVYASADPFHCFPDPEAKDVNKSAVTMGYSDKAPTFCHAEPMDIRQIRKKYPKVKDYIKPDLQDLTQGSKTNSAPMKFRSPVDNKVILEGSPVMDLVDKERALLLTVYLSPEYCEDDFDETKQDTIDPDTGLPGPPEFIQRAKYPNGRKIVTCNGVLCEDADQGYDDQEFPFHRYQNYTLSREFFGMSEVEQLEGPQKTFNKLVSFVLDVLTLMGNPVWIVPTASGIDTENMVNRPGAILEPDGGPESYPQRIEGVQLQPYVMQMIDKMAELFDSVSGSQDITRGAQPSGVTAASAIADLQEAAQTRIRQKARNLDYYLQSFGQQYVSRVLQFYTIPQVFRLTNSQGATKYFKFHVEPYKNDAGESLYRVHHQPYGTDENGNPVAGVDPTQATIFETRGQLDVKVSTGSNLPFAKGELTQEMYDLFDRKIVDNEEVLKRLDYPNYQAVLQRMQIAAQQAAAAQAAAGPPPKQGAA